MEQFITVRADYRQYQVSTDDIMYLTVEQRKCKFHLADGSSLSTNRSLKDVLAELPEDQFSSINRGIVVARAFIREEKDGIVTMQDGTAFRRRTRPQRSGERSETIEDRCPVSTLSEWMNAMPMPMVIMELVKGRRSGMEFLIRYVNPAFCALLGQESESLLGRSIRSIPMFDARRWALLFGEISVNGGTKSAEDVVGEGESYYRLYCYQPQNGFCACVLVDLTETNHFVQALMKK